MSRRPTIVEVEARVRTALRERSGDIRADALPAVPVTPIEASRPRRRHVALTAAIAGVVIVVVGVVAADRLPRDERGSLRTSPADSAPPASKARCGEEFPLRFGAPGATTGPHEGAAPGSASATSGQLARHWLQGDGSIEVRWPAPEPQVYGERLTDPRFTSSMTSETMDRMALDVHPASDALARTAPASATDLVVERMRAADGAELPLPAPPCDVLQVTIEAQGSRWTMGMRLTPATSGLPFELVDLQARVIERRGVEGAPLTAVQCEGAGGERPPNRSGGTDSSVRGAEPVEVLLRYLEMTPAAPQQGYVEMLAPDGSVIYGVDASGRGWTTLVFVARDGSGWVLQGWNASGC